MYVYFLGCLTTKHHNYFIGIAINVEYQLKKSHKNLESIMPTCYTYLFICLFMYLILVTEKITKNSSSYCLTSCKIIVIK